VREKKSGGGNSSRKKNQARLKTSSGEISSTLKVRSRPVNQWHTILSASLWVTRCYTKRRSTPASSRHSGATKPTSPFLVKAQKVENARLRHSVTLRYFTCGGSVHCHTQFSTLAVVGRSFDHTKRGNVKFITDLFAFLVVEKVHAGTGVCAIVAHKIAPFMRRDVLLIVCIRRVEKNDRDVIVYHAYRTPIVFEHDVLDLVAFYLDSSTLERRSLKACAQRELRISLQVDFFDVNGISIQTCCHMRLVVDPRNANLGLVLGVSNLVLLSIEGHRLDGWLDGCLLPFAFWHWSVGRCALLFLSRTPDFFCHTRFFCKHTMLERRFVPILDANQPRTHISRNRDITHHMPPSFLDRQYSYERQSIYNAVYARAADDTHHVMELLAPHLAEVATLKESVLLFQHHAECMDTEELVWKTELKHMESEIEVMQSNGQTMQRLIDGFHSKLKDAREKVNCLEEQLDKCSQSLGRVISYSVPNETYNVAFKDSSQKHDMTANELVTNIPLISAIDMISIIKDISTRRSLATDSQANSPTSVIPAPKMLYGDGYVDKNTKPTVDNSKVEKCFQEHDIGQKIEAALNSVIDKDILPEHPMLAIAEALRGDKVYGYQRGQMLYYVGKTCTFPDGDAVIPGQQGEVVMPIDGTLNIQMHFRGNKSFTNCSLRELSANPPSAITSIDDALLLRLTRIEKKCKAAQNHSLNLEQELSKSKAEVMKLCSAEQERDRLMSVIEKMKTERHDKMIRLNQLAAEYKDMKKTLADDNEAMHSMIAEKIERLDRGLAKIPECAICMDQGPFSWIYKGCRHISVCDACHESGQVKQCPMHDVKQKFDKVEKVYFAFGK
jgi:hypothetical protein